MSAVCIHWFRLRRSSLVLRHLHLRILRVRLTLSSQCVNDLEAGNHTMCDAMPVDGTGSVLGSAREGNLAVVQQLTARDHVDNLAKLCDGDAGTLALRAEQRKADMKSWVSRRQNSDHPRQS